MRSTQVLAFAIASLAMAVVPASVRAYEGRWTLGPVLGAGVSSDNPAGYELAPAVGATIAVGLDDVWNVRTQVLYALHPGDQVLHVGLLSTELVYTIDIVRWVPFFGGGVDAMGMWANGGSDVEAGFHGTLGLDYLWSPTFLVGVEARSVFLPFLEDNDSPSFDSVYVTATVRLEWLFDL